MANKANFSTEEWSRVVASPMVAVWVSYDCFMNS
jgi:hypothetical protein